MNRLLIDNEIKNKKDDVILIDIDSNCNYLINDLLFNKYVFNVNDSNCNIFIDVKDGKNVTYELNINGGEVSFNNVNTNPKDVNIICNLNSKESNVLINNTVLSKSNLVNYDIKINHNSKKTTSDVYNNGVSKENGSICFNVESFVPKNSNLSVVNQDSKIIALNSDNENKINPVLLIDEFDSEARHAAFIGDFNPDKLFYLMSRGLTKKKARDLLLNGLLIGELDLCFEEKERLKEKIITW